MERMIMVTKENQVLNIEQGSRKAKRIGSRQKIGYFAFANQDAIECMIILMISSCTIKRGNQKFRSVT
jgi:hypothetical protein